MTSTPVVLCYAFPTPPVVAFDIFIELARRHEDEFALLDNMAVTDLSEDQRERVQAIMRVVKGIFVICDRPFFFPVKCEMAIFFLVNRDFYSSREP